MHGNLSQQFVIYNARGSDVVLTRIEAVNLYHQLGQALKASADIDTGKAKPQSKK